MNDEYVIQMPLSYADFLEANGLKEVSTEQIEAWGDSVVNKFQYDLTTTPQEVMDFFRIENPELEEAIRNKGFKISANIELHDTEKKVILYVYKLTFNGIILG